MSTQSGITTSQELLDVFKSLESQPLIIKISSDSTQLIPDSNFTSTTSQDLPATFQSINDYISSEYPQPSYIIIPDGGSNEECIFISFIPDIAPIKQKMLYASTKNTLLTSLGSYKFPKNKLFAWTDLDELTFDNYEKSIQDSTKSGPLSQDERLLNQLNTMQSLSIAGSQTSYLSVPKFFLNGRYVVLLLYLGDVDPELTKELEGLVSSGDSLKLIIFNIKNEVVTLTSSQTGVVLDSLITSGSPVRERMVYAASKVNLTSRIDNILKKDNLSINKNIEIGDLDELELSELEIESEVATPSSVSSATSATKQGLKFNKPKGPRRR
ncbi:TWF1 [[Candida] subhashii]|uniref:TWF1 n=1 Tax=[Candida] subhashii TaxID=561895 RepID=A0A8J5Q4F7_9ASCO|nr:TWF1 [[Candida] subhashii]KAG7661484.1 TWF1 [[Candida] subhashii]